MLCKHNIAMIPFVNRKKELKELSLIRDNKGLLVVFGRRRVGKTRLLVEWLKKRQGIYTQAIQASVDIQVKQVFQDIKPHLDLNIEPKSWQELFELLDLTRKEFILCIDEFPYLVLSDSSLPSILQRWLDHKRNPDISLIIAGSSQRMMHEIFLSRNAPLYGRAEKILHIKPMEYTAFCEALNFEHDDTSAFNLFAMVGGVPRYWEFIDKSKNLIKNAEALYFGYAPYLEQEPLKLLSDEKIEGITPINILEAVGRGASKLHSIASVIGTKQTNLSRMLQRLTDMSILKRDIPFGESERSSKKSLYTISDPVLRFWYSVYSPHRSRWQYYTQSEKMKLLADHASTVFEDYCRERKKGARRYWEKNCEFDWVLEIRKNRLQIGEVKYSRINKTTKEKIIKNIKEKFHQSSLAKKYKKIEVIVESLDDI